MLRLKTIETLFKKNKIKKLSEAIPRFGCKMQQPF